MCNSADTSQKLTNGAISIISTNLRHRMSSAAEAEIGSVFINAKEGAVLRTTFEELGHLQPPIPLETYKITGTSHINGTTEQKHTKIMDIRFYWIKDRVKQGQFDL
jgi:Golgi nucleoside diphosphatase